MTEPAPPSGPEEPERLPPELEELERRLQERRDAQRPEGGLMGPGPDSGVELRVLDLVRAELRSERARERWTFAAAALLAASLLVNLSWSAVGVTDPLGSGADRAMGRDRVAAAARCIEELLPEAGPDIARREALLLRILGTWHPAYIVPPPPRAGPPGRAREEMAPSSLEGRGAAGTGG